MLLDYVTHINVADGNDLLDKIRQFAVTKGWVQEEWQSQMGWEGSGSSYGFVSDTDCAFLCLSTTGYGTTPIIVKIYLGHGGPGTNINSLNGVYLYTAMCESATIDYTSDVYPYVHNCISTPYQQINNSYNTKCSFAGLNVSKTETINQVWIFGDDKWICAVVNYDGYNCHQIHFGQFEMFEANPYQGMVCGWTAQCKYNTSPTTYLHHYPAEGQIGSAWWRVCGSLGSNHYVGNGDLCYSDDDSYPKNTVRNILHATQVAMYGCNLYPATIGSTRERTDYKQSLTKAGFNLEKAIRLNAHGSARIMSKIAYFAQSRIDSTYIPVCKSSIYLTRFDSLAIGEVLTYGAEEYMFFPLAHITDTWGIAFRIA
jgi:hypothetical protein